MPDPNAENMMPMEMVEAINQADTPIEPIKVPEHDYPVCAARDERLMDEIRRHFGVEYFAMMAGRDGPRNAEKTLTELEAIAAEQHELKVDATACP